MWIPATSFPRRFPHPVTRFSRLPIRRPILAVGLPISKSLTNPAVKSRSPFVITARNVKQPFALGRSARILQASVIALQGLKVLIFLSFVGLGFWAYI